MDEDQVDLWITEMTIFLSIGLPLEGMPLDERKRLSVRSRNFYLLNDTLYHKGADGIWRQTVRHYKKEAVLHEAYAKLLVVMMQEKRWERKFGIAACGGRLPQKTQLAIVDSAVYASGLDNPPKKIGCRISRYYLWSHLKNGVSTLSDLSNQ